MNSFKVVAGDSPGQWLVVDDEGSVVCLCFEKAQADDIAFALDRHYDLPDPER